MVALFISVTFFGALIHYHILHTIITFYVFEFSYPFNILIIFFTGDSSFRTSYYLYSYYKVTFFVVFFHTDVIIFIARYLDQVLCILIISLNLDHIIYTLIIVLVTPTCTMLSSSMEPSPDLTKSK